MGKAAIASSRCVTNQQINAIVVDESAFCPEFIYYNLSRRQAEIRGLAGGSAQPIMNKSAFGQLLFDAPNLAEQKRISATLRPIDDRITLLRETNTTLEAIAQALFKSWFVDFDPVHAKMQGRPPEGVDEATAALFPDSFGESELGPVPKGWITQVVGDLLVPKRGKSITKSKCIDGNVPVVAGGLEPAYFHNQSNVSSPVVTISASGANAGFVRLYQKNIWASDCSFVSKEQTDSIYFWYVFLRSNQDNIYFMQQGAAQPHIYPSDLMRLNICMPASNNLFLLFHNFVLPLFEKIGLADAQIQTLSELRDTLLPRLISGQLRIEEAQQALA
jgi:type I restriction enzyme S subunit